MRDFLVLIKPFRSAFLLAILALFCSSFFNAGLTLLAQPLLDDVLSDTSTLTEPKTEKVIAYRERMELATVWLQDHGIAVPDFSGSMSPFAWAFLALLFFLGEAVFDFFGTYLLGRVGISVVVNLRQDIIDKVMGLSMRFFSQMNSGDVLTRLNSDVMRIQTAISVKMGELGKEATRCMIYVFMAFWLDWKLSLTLFLLVPMVGIPMNIFTRKIRRFSSRSQTYLSSLTSRFKEVLTGIRIVKGFQREPFESAKLGSINQSFDHFAVRELKIIALTRPVMSAIGMLVLLSFIVYGSLMIKGGHISSGEFVVYILAIYQLYQPIKRIARANSEIQQAVGVLPRIQELMSWNNEILEVAQPKRFPNYPNLSEVSYQKVCFSYTSDNSRPLVLSEVDLKINRGQVVALVGSSGSGKSSMSNLLPRFYDVTGGSIQIDGVDIRDMSKDDLRGLIAIVTQDTVLFDDSVFNNIAYGREDLPLEMVEAAARKAFAHHFIEELEQGYQTFIGENGNKLSGGQRQRLSIARAILKDAPVLILDEATSALDTESEKEVQMALDNLMETKTTLVIAHRLSTIRGADHIVVLDQGQIVQRGNHQSLLAEEGIYRKLIEMQEEGRHAL